MAHLGLYVHIPFCVRKCAYCDFSSWPGRKEDMQRYTDALCDEIRARARETGRQTCDTVFFGGGTPSILPDQLFAQIVSTLRACYDFAADTEFTVECNPGTVTESFAKTMRACGVNRVSMGMQAAQEALLRRLNRIHSMDDVKTAVATLRNAGIDNLNLDLMLGLPGQTLNDMRDTLQAALSLSPQHISCYALIVEEGTPLARAVDKGEMTLPGEDLDREMYGLCRETLQKAGFEQYEISNFALPGRICRHNAHCWQRAPYLGFGCAAHSFYDEVRRANPAGLNAYLNGEAPETERISREDALFEKMMLGLRLTKGVSEKDFENEFHVSLFDVYGAKLQPALSDGRLCREDGRVYLTEHGMDVMNSVLVELME